MQQRAVEQAATFPIVITARRDGRTPVPGVKIIQEKSVLGVTDEAGTIRLVLQGEEGAARRLHVVCPESYASPEAAVVVGLRALAKGSPEPRFSVECVPLQRTVVVGLRVEKGANLPIVWLNEVIGQTDEFGVAHVTIQAAPEEAITLTLDTTSNPRLKPQNPPLTFVVKDRDELILMEYKFGEKPKRVTGPVRPKNIPQPL